VLLLKKGCLKCHAFLAKGWSRPGSEPQHRVRQPA
jgi:hypothetical protein